jgi:leucyl-tRNA synthetase
MEMSIEKRLMHTYVANVMEMFNLVKEFVELGSKIIEKANKVKLFAVFVRVLRIVAPELTAELRGKLVKKFGTIVRDEDFDRWPSDDLFGEKIEVLVMKGKKMVAKDTVDVGLEDEEIVKVLKIEGNIKEIKRQKKKYVVILKE